MSMKLSKRCPAQKNIVPFIRNTKTSKITVLEDRAVITLEACEVSNDFEGAGGSLLGVWNGLHLDLGCSNTDIIQI